MWPVAMAEALGVVKVGNSEWVLVKRTPCFNSMAIVGAVFSLTMPGRKPSATNRMTLWGALAGCSVGGAAEAEASRNGKSEAAASKRRIKETPHKRCRSGNVSGGR